MSLGGIHGGGDRMDDAWSNRLEMIEMELSAVTDEFTEQDYVDELANIGITGD